MYLNLMLITLIPIVITIGLYFLVEKTKFGKIPYKWQQAIIGIIFGLIAISGTEFGVSVNGATANVRDAAPLLAGLIFGGPAGIVAGVIGGVERFFAAYWGRGTITQVACSVSTLLAGIFAALLRKHFFENKRPSPGFAFAIAIVVEVFHFVMAFVTNLNQTDTILKIIKSLAIPMILANAVAVTVPTLVIFLINRKKEGVVKGRRKIRDKVKWWLLGSIIACYVVSAGVVFAVQTNEAYQNANTAFKITINDIEADVKQTADIYMKSLIESVKKEYDKDPYKPEYTTEKINELRKKYNSWLPDFYIGSIDVIKKDAKGSFVCSSDLAFKMDTFWMTFRAEGQTEASQSERLHNEMMKPNVDVYVQEFGQRADTQKGIIYTKYAAKTIDNDYYLVIGINEENFYPFIDEKVKATVMFRHINEHGHILIMDAKDKQVTDYKDYIGKESGLTLNKLKAQGAEYTRLRGDVYGEDCFYTYTTAETYTLVVILPYDDVLSSRDSSFMLNTFMQILAYSVMFILMYMLLNKLVVKKIEYVSDGLNQITNGNLEVKLSDNSSKEFEDLSNDINLTVDALKRYIEEARKRIDDELAFAKTIQLSALPSTFPAFPDKKQFDIYATMNTAKEVGGDFYDFYIVDNDTLAFLIADVSGKGIPAAMFMMEGKAIIKNLAKNLLSADEVMAKANDALAQNNDASMFITCWFGLLNFRTGHVTYANAGHNAPLIYRKGQGYEYIPQKKNLVLAAMEGMPYTLQEFDLNPGDKIFLYTDGVTEATRGDKALYGEERLLKYLNANKGLNLQNTLAGVQIDIDKFIEGADQFDDITMLSIEYRGEEK